MKGFVLAFAFLTITASAFAESPSKFEEFVEECKSEIGITEEPPRFDDDDPKSKCFYACVTKKMGQLVDGKLVLEKVLESAKDIPDMDDTKKAKITECINKGNAESDECEIAHTYGKCLMEHFYSPDS